MLFLTSVGCWTERPWIMSVSRTLAPASIATARTARRAAWAFFMCILEIEQFPHVFYGQLQPQIHRGVGLKRLVSLVNTVIDVQENRLQRLELKPEVVLRPENRVDGHQFRPPLEEDLVVEYIPPYRDADVREREVIPFVPVELVRVKLIKIIRRNGRFNVNHVEPQRPGETVFQILE